MFYSEFVLTKKGKLAKIWLAAHWEKKLTKAQIFETDISKSVDTIKNPEAPIALRTSGHLLLGVVKIYSRKVKYIVAECSEAMARIRLQTTTSAKVDLPERSNTATFSAITLPEKLTEVDLMLPDVDLSTVVLPGQVIVDENGEAIQQGMQLSRIGDINMEDFDKWYTAETPEIRFTPSQRPPLTPAAPTTPGVEELEITMRERQQTPQTGGFDTIVPINELLGTLEEMPIGGPAPESPEPFTFGAPLSPLREPGEEEEAAKRAAEEREAAERAEAEKKAAEEAERQKRKRVHPVKLGKALYDRETEIDRDDYAEFVNNTRDTKRRRLNAPSTRQEMERQISAAKTMEELFSSTSIRLAAPELQEFWNSTAAATAPAPAPVTPAPSVPATPAPRTVPTTPAGAETPIEIPRREDPRDEYEPPIGGPLDFHDEPVAPSPVAITPQREQPFKPIEEDMDFFQGATGDIPAEEIRAAPEDKQQEMVRRQQEKQELKRKHMSKGITDRTIDVLMVFNNEFRAGRESVSFDRVLAGRRKKTAARCFAELLSLKTLNLVNVRQDEPYGDITVTPREVLTL